MKTFEELPVWLEGRALVRNVYKCTRSVHDPDFCDQAPPAQFRRRAARLPHPREPRFRRYA